MESIQIGFVILHYMVKSITIKAVESIIKNVDIQNYKIVIVDNASPNQTGQELKSFFQEDKKIEVILNDYNMGFAKGNNQGFLYLKNNFECKFIVMMNNDVILLEEHLSEKLDQAYRKIVFDIAGPLIMTGDGICNKNPFETGLNSKKRVERKLKQFYLEAFTYKFHFHFMWDALRWGKKTLKKRWLSKKPNKDYLSVQEGVRLHGCFLIFSENYIKDYNGLDERTFMYGEEDVLFIHMMGLKRKTVYLPNIIVYHEGSIATENVKSGNRDKDVFILKNHIQSYKVLLDVFDEHHMD